MPLTVLRPTALVATLAAAFIVGVAPATRGVHEDGDDITAAGRSVAAASSAPAAPLPRTEWRPAASRDGYTASVALDRLDQHARSLDDVFRPAATGRDVTVYLFDGGVLDTHPELVGRVRRGFDGFPGGDRICNAHGTAVAGAVAGTTLGVAPQAQIVDVKMVECRRMRGSIDAIVRAAHWVIADHAQHPEQRAVANWSFVADTAASVAALDDAVVALRAAGIPVVVSAGNVELDACNISPGNAPGAIVVGASRVLRTTEASRTFRDVRVPHTAFGRCIDVFAPGDAVLLPGIDSTGAPITQLWSGTSMSAGYVSGAAALYLETAPHATVDEVRNHITRSSAYVTVDARSPRAGVLYVGAVGRDARRVAVR